MDFANSARAARTRWKGVVVKLSVALQQPRRLIG